MTCESGVMPEDWRFAVTIPLYRGNGDRTKGKNYIGISLSMVGKIHVGILLDRIHRVARNLINEEQRGL